MLIIGWLSQFVGWLRDAVGGDTAPLALETHFSKDGQATLQLLADDQTDSFPGLVQLWLVSHEAAHFDLLIILVNIAQARIVQKHDAIDALPKDWHREFEIKARACVKEQSTISASHLFFTGWVSKQPISARFVRSKLEYFRRVECSVVLALDLQGNTVFWTGQNDYAVKIVRAIALRALNTEAGKVLTWEALLRSLDGGGTYSQATWLTWLHHYATKPKSTRIAERHTLQPPRLRSTLRIPQGEL